MLTADSRRRLRLAAMLMSATRRACAELDELDAHEIKEQLLSSYQLPSTRPAIAAAKLVPNRTSGACRAVLADLVEAQVYIDRLHPLDPYAQTYGLDGYVRAWWSDPRLRYNGSCGDELLFTRSEALTLWKPDLYWEKAVSVDLPPLQPGYEKGSGEMCVPPPRCICCRNILSPHHSPSPPHPLFSGSLSHPTAKFSGVGKHGLRFRARWT